MISRKKRKVPELNTTSTADMAFIMLFFFLITTSMDVDSGIMRRLPPPVDPIEKPEDINKRNLFEVRINSQDHLWVKGQYMSIGDLKDATKTFIANKSNDPHLSDKKEVHIPLFPGGTYMASKGIISLKNDRATSYDMYIQVQNELAKAIAELRNELSKEQFGVSFSDLIDKRKIEAIQKAIPVAISEAEPENVEKK
jgi:biopolymer transport protein ExbD